MQRAILHVDLNNFYASVEIKLNPLLHGKDVAVTGSVENRHGIVLAKSESAKKLGVKTGMTIREALKLCPNLITVEAKHDKYLAYSALVKNIYRRYTNFIEPFGIDECWLDVTSSIKMFGSARKIAEEIRESVKKELGLTVSIGVSFNKVFAKLGSDYKKPDAVTIIDEENYKKIVWELPIDNLLFVGRSTALKLNKINVKTIGDLAILDRDFVVNKFGKWGRTLHEFALGQDNSLVNKDEEGDEIKSVGNSITSYRDLVCDDDVKIVFRILSESVSSRVINSNMGNAKTLAIFVRDSELNSITRQATLPYPTALPEDFEHLAFNLFKKFYPSNFMIRTLGVSVSGFTKNSEQITIFDGGREKFNKLNDAIGQIKDKYGNKSMVKGIVLKDKKLLKEDPEEEHVVHPIGHV